MPTHYLKLSEVIQAFDELDGEADWADIQGRVERKRGNDFAPYKSWSNYRTTMRQIVQEHCEGYEKFKRMSESIIHFVKVRENPLRYRLVSPSGSVPEGNASYIVPDQDVPSLAGTDYQAGDITSLSARTEQIIQVVEEVKERFNSSNGKALDVRRWRIESIHAIAERRGITWQTVNLLAYAFAGSNPALPTSLKSSWQEWRNSPRASIIGSISFTAHATRLLQNFKNPPDPGNE